jgi:hypothetical protein
MNYISSHSRKITHSKLLPYLLPGIQQIRAISGSSDRIAVMLENIIHQAPLGFYL